MGWFLYVLECQGGSLYTGISRNVAQRFAAHLKGKGARYTRMYPPERVVLELAFPDKSAALRAEHALKAMTTLAKRRFVAEHGILQSASPCGTGMPESADSDRPGI